MPVYTGRMIARLAENLVIELNLEVTGQSTASNQTNFKYTLKMKRRGKDNWNDNFHGDAKIWMNVGGQQILDGAGAYWSQRTIDHDGSPTSETLLKSGTFSVKHDADGTKKANVDVTVNPHTRDFSWGDAAIMRINESLTLTPISRKISLTMSPSSTITLGSTLKVNVSGGTSTNYHSAYLYVDGESHVIGRRTGNGSISGKIPSDLVKSATAKKLSGSVRVFSYTSSTNLTSIGSPTRAITVSVPANAPIAPSVTGSTITGTGLKSGFMGASQHVAGKSVLTATVKGASAQSGSNINLYEVKVVASGTSTTIMSGTSTTSTVSLGTVPQVTPAAGQTVDVITRVRDNRNIWSSEKKQSSLLRFHRYSTPSGSGSTRRSGTSAIVDISWSVTSIKENGSTEKNSAKIYIDTKERSSTTWGNKYANTSAALSGTYKATLTGYSTTTSYDVRLRVIDALGTTIVSLNSLGTESVPLDVTQRGIGVGTIHSGSGANLQVGSGGIDTEGKIRENGTSISEGKHLNYKTFTVGGNANSYYPVVIASEATFGFHRYSISRGYNWAAPNTWNTSTHRGGLTLDLEWSGDVAWGGNDKAIRVIEWNETYTTIAGGLGLARTGGLVVWLRGGGAQYRLRSERGQYASHTVYLNDFTDGSGAVFPVRTSPVASEINNRYPVRGSGTLYDSGNKLWHAGNDGSGSGLDADLLDGKHASEFATKGDIPTIPTIPKAYSPTWGGSGNNRWIKFPSGHQICWGSTTTKNSSASATYPRAFTATPMITVTGQYENFAPSTTVSKSSKSAATFYVVDGRNGGLWGGTYTSGKEATLSYIAVGMG